MDLRALPKVELHLHLDCSLSYEAVSHLAPSVTRQEYDSEFVAPAKCTNLAEFLKRAPKGFQLMQNEYALRHATEDVFRQLQDDGVIYAELLRSCTWKKGSLRSAWLKLWIVPPKK
jgi:adenosine deaminase